MEQPALTGVKVLDFGWALVGSLTGKHLADNGAKVIRVESASRIDLSRTNRMVKISSGNNPDDKPWYTHLNTSKLSLALNLKESSVKGYSRKTYPLGRCNQRKLYSRDVDQIGYGL